MKYVVLLRMFFGRATRRYLKAEAFHSWIDRIGQCSMLDSIFMKSGDTPALGRKE